MKLFLFATEQEAAASIEKWGRTFDWGEIVITGWGSQAAYAATLAHGPKASAIYNLGLAGALIDDLTLDSVYPIATVSSPPLHLQEQGLHLFTSNVPIHDRSQAPRADLVDMEGWGVAQAAHELGKPCSLWKVVSDFASPGGSALIQKHMAQYSASLCEVVCALQ